MFNSANSRLGRLTEEILHRSERHVKMQLDTRHDSGGPCCRDVFKHIKIM